jgi:hypothetical protein
MLVENGTIRKMFIELVGGSDQLARFLEAHASTSA